MANYFAVAAWALVALLLVANIALRIGTLEFVSSDRLELLAPQHSNPTQTPATTPASAPDVRSETILPTQPAAQSAPEALGTIESAPAAADKTSEPGVVGTVEPATNAARAEEESTNSVTRKRPPIKQPQQSPINQPQQPPINQPQLGPDRFSIKD